MPIQIREHIGQQDNTIQTEKAVLQDASTILTEKKADTKEAAKEAGKEEIRKDEARLSDQSKYHNLTLEQLKNLLPLWTLESEMALWQELLNFQFSGIGFALEDFEKLFKLYQSLQTAIFNNLQGADQQIQLERLDAALSKVLDQFVKGQMPNIGESLIKHQMKEEYTVIKNTLYKSVTGRLLPPKEMERFWAKAENIMMQKTSNNVATAQKAQAEQGIIYKKGGKGTVAANQVFHKEVQQEQERMVRTGNQSISFDKNMMKLSGKAGTQTVQLSDIKKMESFLNYVRSEGNLFTNEQWSAKNEELTGVAAVAMAIKGNLYVNQSQMGNQGAGILLKLVDKMIDYHLSLTEQFVNHSEQSRQSDVLFEAKEAYKIYYKTLIENEKGGQSKNSILQGIKDAIEIFQQKKTEGPYKDTVRYGQYAGFYKQADNTNQTIAQLLAEGKFVIDRDWRAFLKILNKNANTVVTEEMLDSRLKEIYKMGLWGTPMQVQRDEEKKALKKQYTLIIAGIILACAILVGILGPLW